MQIRSLRVLALASLLALTSLACSSAAPEASERAETDAAVGSTGGSMIQGDLTIRGTELVDLKDFAWITGISGNLVIEGNRQLKSVDGLGSLEGVQGDVIIRKNPSLRRGELRRLVARLETSGARHVVIE